MFVMICYDLNDPKIGEYSLYYPFYKYICFVIHANKTAWWTR